MKLRTRINDPGRMMALSKVIQAVSKLSKSVVIRVTREQIVLTGDETTYSKYRYWCTIQTVNLFSSFEMEGVLDTGTIQIELNCTALSKALKFVNSQSKSLSIRLSKSMEQPVLNVTIEEPCHNSHKCRPVSHNIPIYVMSTRLWAEYDKIEYPVQLRFDLGDMAAFSATIRRMQRLQKMLLISLNTSQKEGVSGTRTFRTVTVASKSTACTIRSQFRNVRLSPVTTGIMSSDPPADPNNMKLAVDAKLVNQFVNAFKKRGSFLSIGMRDQQQHQYMTLQMVEPDFAIDYVIPILVTPDVY